MSHRGMGLETRREGILGLSGVRPLTPQHLPQFVLGLLYGAEGYCG